MQNGIHIVSVGEELLSGSTADTNARNIAIRLRQEGYSVRGVSVVGDDIGEIEHAIRSAIQDSSAVIVTGGLGPTRDDVTRDALAAASGGGLVEDSDVLRELVDRFQHLGREMPASNRVQAQKPAGAVVLRNRLGTAPGLQIAVDGVPVFSLPGVPMEMGPMLDEEVIPVLKKLLGEKSAPPGATIRAHGIAESEVGERLEDLMGGDRGPAVGITVSAGVISVAITSASAESSNQILVEDIACDVERRLGTAFFGRGDSTLEKVVVDALLSQGKTLAVAESCTGGLVAHLLTRVPGVSQCLLEGLVTYSNEAKVQRLGIDPGLIQRVGAVSEEVSEAMAMGVVSTLGASIGVGITGIAGPGGGTAEKPVGLVHFGLCVEGVVSSRRAIISGDREGIQLRAAHIALDMIRRALMESPSSAA